MSVTHAMVQGPSLKQVWDTLPSYQDLPTVGEAMKAVGSTAQKVFTRMQEVNKPLPPKTAYRTVMELCQSFQLPGMESFQNFLADQARLYREGAFYA